MLRKKTQPKATSLNGKFSAIKDPFVSTKLRKTLSKSKLHVAPVLFIIISIIVFNSSDLFRKSTLIPNEDLLSPEGVVSVEDPNSNLRNQNKNITSEKSKGDDLRQEMASKMIPTDEEKEVVVDQHDDTVKQATNLQSYVKMYQGTESNSWALVDWNKPISSEEEEKFKCEWTSFQSASSGKEAQMCVHPFHDFVSDELRNKNRWGDCNILPRLWNATSGSTTEDKKSTYVEIGANIGSCVMEMLLGTDANIIAFEPHPMNVYNLKKTVSKLDKSYQNRLKLFPIGLGDDQGKSTIYSAKNNMGNSVIGKVIKDYDTQEFSDNLQFTIHVERMDSVLNNNTDMKLVKMDAQGFECKILEGIGEDLASKMEAIKFEYEERFLTEQNCTDLLPRLMNYGFDKFWQSNEIGFSKQIKVPPPVIDLFASKRKIES